MILVNDNLCLTHWGRDKMATISKMPLLNAFSWMKMLEFRHKAPINNISALVAIMTWCRPGDKPLSVQVMIRSPTHIFVTPPQWVKDMGRRGDDIVIADSKDICHRWWRCRYLGDFLLWSAMLCFVLSVNITVIYVCAHCCYPVSGFYDI